MKKYMFWIAFTALALPVLARGLWFYRGIAPSRPAIETPDYQSLSSAKMPQHEAQKEATPKQIGGAVLLDYMHGNQFQPHELQRLKEEIEKRGGRIEPVTDSSMLEYKLKYASAYIVVSPSMPFTADEIRIAQNFVQRGGRLLAFTDATRGYTYTDYFNGTTINYSDAASINSLLAPHGITVNNDYLYNVNQNDGNFRNVFFEKFGKDNLTTDLKQVAMYGAHSVKSPAGILLLQGDALTLSSIDDSSRPEEGGAALSADGNVLAFGDFTFLTSPYYNAADNPTLIANIADFVLSGKREVSLVNFPFLFKESSVKIYPSSEVTLTAEAIYAISGLRKNLAIAGTSLDLTEKAPRKGDAIILGTYESTEDMEDFLAPFNIEVDEGDYVTLPKLGKIGRYGNGILLFENDKSGSRLILLADTPEDMVSLINTLASGSLDGCVIQGNIGICSVGYGGYYDDKEEGGTTPTDEYEGQG